MRIICKQPWYTRLIAHADINQSGTPINLATCIPFECWVCIRKPDMCIRMAWVSLTQLGLSSFVSQFASGRYSAQPSPQTLPLQDIHVHRLHIHKHTAGQGHDRTDSNSSSTNLATCVILLFMCGARHRAKCCDFAAKRIHVSQLVKTEGGCTVRNMLRKQSAETTLDRRGYRSSVLYNFHLWVTLTGYCEMH